MWPRKNRLFVRGFGYPETVNPFIMLVAVLLAAAVRPATAEVRVHHLFDDNMVLQRGMPVPVWGTADVGERVTVEIAGQSVSATADDQGRWSVRLAPMMAGGPLSMTIALQHHAVRKRVCENAHGSF